MADRQEKASSRAPAEQEAQPAAPVDDDEPDEWEQRINRTGCAAENEKLTDCYYEKKDWRACTAEMKAFQDCWKQNQNDQRTDMTDAKE